MFLQFGEILHWLAGCSATSTNFLCQPQHGAGYTGSGSLAHLRVPNGQAVTELFLCFRGRGDYFCSNLPLWERHPGEVCLHQAKSYRGRWKLISLQRYMAELWQQLLQKKVTWTNLCVFCPCSVLKWVDTNKNTWQKYMVLGWMSFLFFCELALSIHLDITSPLVCRWSTICHPGVIECSGNPTPWCTLCVSPMVGGEQIVDSKATSLKRKWFRRVCRISLHCQALSIEGSDGKPGRREPKSLCL